MLAMLPRVIGSEMTESQTPTRGTLHDKSRHYTVVPDSIVRESGIALEARALWMVIKSFSSKEKPIPFPSISYLTEVAGKSRETISKYLHELENHQLLTREISVSRPTQYYLRDARIAAVGISDDGEMVDGNLDAKEPQSKEPHLDSNESTIKRRVTRVTEPFIVRMVSEYGSQLGGEDVVREEIQKCMNYKSFPRTSDKTKMVINWLGNAVKFKHDREQNQPHSQGRVSASEVFRRAGR